MMRRNICRIVCFANATRPPALMGADATVQFSVELLQLQEIQCWSRAEDENDAISTPFSTPEVNCESDREFSVKIWWALTLRNEEIRTKSHSVMSFWQIRTRKPWPRQVAIILQVTNAKTEGTIKSLMNIYVSGHECSTSIRRSWSETRLILI